MEQIFKLSFNLNISLKVSSKTAYIDYHDHLASIHEFSLLTFTNINTLFCRDIVTKYMYKGNVIPCWENKVEKTLNRNQ